MVADASLCLVYIASQEDEAVLRGETIGGTCYSHVVGPRFRHWHLQVGKALV